MAEIAANRGLIFVGDDLTRPRMVVENEKMKRYFPDFRFCGSSGGSIVAVEGFVKTADGNFYYTRIDIPKTYPYEMPSVSLPQITVESDCPHRYINGKLCVMKPEQWSSAFSLAFMVGKAAIWLNKYDVWKRVGSWPGTEQQHT